MGAATAPNIFIIPKRAGEVNKKLCNEYKFYEFNKMQRVI